MHNLSETFGEEVIQVLVEHQKRTLERKFPDYECFEAFQYSSCFLRVQTVRKNIEDVTRMIFIASFSPSSIQVMVGRVGMTTLWWLPPFDTCDVILDLDYADPKFTDDTISDMLEKLENA